MGNRQAVSLAYSNALAEQERSCSANVTTFMLRRFGWVVAVSAG